MTLAQVDHELHVARQLLELVSSKGSGLPAWVVDMTRAKVANLEAEQAELRQLEEDRVEVARW